MFMLLMEQWINKCQRSSPYIVGIVFENVFNGKSVSFVGFKNILRYLFWIDIFNVVMSYDMMSYRRGSIEMFLFKKSCFSFGFYLGN